MTATNMKRGVKIAVAIGTCLLTVLAVLIVWLTLTSSSCSRQVSRWEAEYGRGVEREVTLYSMTGEEIGRWEGIIDVEYTDGRVDLMFFDENGDEYLQVDLNNALAKIIPDHTSAETYNYPGQAHDDAVASWPDAANYLPNGPEDLWNGDAHLRSTILGSSEVFDVVDGHLGVGTTGYIYFADFDRTRPRERRCVITVIGE